MRPIAILSLLTLLSGCDTVEERYPTLQDARNDRLFERGWLPDILPTSARDIRTINDLDVNTSKGEFFFSPSDFPQFSRHVTAATHPAEPPAQGFVAYELSRDQSQWRFLCDAPGGRCSYEMHRIGRVVDK